MRFSGAALHSWSGLLFVSGGAERGINSRYGANHNNARKPAHADTARSVPSNRPSHSYATSVTVQLTGSDAKYHRPGNAAVHLDSDSVNSTAVLVEYTGPPIQYSYEKHWLHRPGWASG
jgi:hypothetical protein